MSNKDRDHTKCRKLGTSDLCVCCPCGCDTPMDAPNYAELHGAPTEQKEYWEEELYNLAAINYNLYLSGTCERADTGEDWTFDDARWEIRDFIRTQIALAEERGRMDGEAEGAKRMTAKVRGVFMLYPQEVHDELSIVLKDYLDELSTLTQKL